MDAKPVDDPPHSMEKYDEGALLPEQQIKINELKVCITCNFRLSSSMFSKFRFKNVLKTNVTFKNILNWMFSYVILSDKLVYKNPTIFVNLLLVCCSFLVCLFVVTFSRSGYFTHPMLEQRMENLMREQMETMNADIKVISEEIYQR